MRAYRAYHFTILPSEKTDIASAWLTTFPFESFVEHDNGISAYIPLEEVAAITLSDCIAVPFEGLEISVAIEDIEGQNWNAVWEKNFLPISVDEWTIRASFHKPAQTPKELIIDPQMSFGTGHHATTQLMFSQILKLSFENASVLDVGTGTGVLAIIAKQLGAVSATGIDIEDWCVVNAKDNALKNDISDINFSTDTLHSIDSKFDFMFANINRNVLQEHLPEYVKLLNKNGVLLLSGFHEKDVDVLTNLAHTHGLRYEDKTEKDGWICLKFLH